MPRADSRLLVLAVVLLSVPAPSKLAAQLPQPATSWCLPPDNGGARVWGTVYDSVSLQPLSALMIQLQPVDDSGAPRHNGYWARTDSLGRFCIRGVYVQPGRYRLTAIHQHVVGRHRAAPMHRDLRVESAADTAVSMPYRSFLALDSMTTERIRDSLLAVIRDHRQLWRATRPVRYHYEAQPNCLCPGPSVSIVVEGDSVIGTVDPKTGIERLQHVSDALTMDGIFDWLERDVRNPDNNRWRLSWDTKYGFPAHWEAGRDIIVIDAYGGATITRFEPAAR